MLFGGVVDEDVQTAECLGGALDRVPAKRLIAPTGTSAPNVCNLGPRNEPACCAYPTYKFFQIG